MREGTLLGRYDFVIFAQGRSGTHMLATALDSHLDLSVDGENEGDSIISPHAFSSSGVLRGRIVTYQQKTQLFDIRPGRIIHLKRDPFYVAVSMVRNITKAWDSRTLPVKMVEKWYRKTKSDHQFWDNYLPLEFGDDRLLTIWYKQLTGGREIDVLPQEMSRRLCRFLGVRNWELWPTTSKRSDWLRE
jgi:hypothetical protein